MGEEAVRQAVLHGLIAAGFVEAVLGAWRIRAASARQAFWVLGLAFPLVVLPAYLVAAPFRLDDHFASGPALFASVRWAAVRPFGVRVDRVVLVLLTLAGTALFLRDLFPLVGGWWRDRAEASHALATPPGSVRTLIDENAARLGIRTPVLTLLEAEHPVAFVRGVRRHTLVISTGLLARLPPEQLHAVVAHELAHVRFRDPLVGWLLMAARLAMFWNPAVQLMARAVAQEAEHRADASAVAEAGAQAFNDAFRALLPAGSRVAPAGIHGALHRLAAVANRHHVNARAAAVFADASPTPRLLEKLGATGGALAAILFLVV